MAQVTRREAIPTIVGDDGAIVRELASPLRGGLTRHSLAEIRHPPGTASFEHYHWEAEEVYYVLSGWGAVRLEGETWPLAPGAVALILPGQRHKVWAEGEEDLVLLVTCAPPYSPAEVVFTEEGHNNTQGGIASRPA